MKKFITMITVALLVAVASNAADSGFFGSGAAGATVVIPAADGTLNAENVLLSIATNATVTVKVGSVAFNPPASTSTNIVIATSSSNTVRGVTLTTSDYLIVGDNLRSISALSPASANSTTATVSSAVTIVSGQDVWVADAGNDISLAATTTWANYPIPFLFNGRANGPAAIVVPSTAGATMVSGEAVRK